jgi:YVTN family beta-propeller protein
MIRKIVCCLIALVLQFTFLVPLPVGAATTARPAALSQTSLSVGVVSSLPTSIPVGTEPFGVAVDATTNRIYVTNYGSSTVSVIDAGTNTVITTISVGFAPIGVAVNSKTGRVYVTNLHSNTVSVIDGTTNTVIATILVGTGPQGWR